MKRTGTALGLTLLILAVVLVATPAFAVRIKIATKTPENFKSARLVKQMTQEIEEEDRWERTVQGLLRWGQGERQRPSSQDEER